MAISCAHCGGTHLRPDQVRACWAGETKHIEPVRCEVDDDDHNLRARLSPHSVQPPSILGRHLIITASTATADSREPVPSAWTACEQILISDEILGDHTEVTVLLSRIRTARTLGQSVVWVLQPGTSWDPSQPPNTVEVTAAEVLGAQYCFDLDDLHHLMWSQSLDLRDPQRPSWRIIDQALTLGAHLPSEQETGDLVVPGVGPVWVDAGPLRYVPPILSESGAKVAVLSAVSIAHGSLEPPRSGDCDAELAPDQLAAVTYPGSALRVIAPAGSGKTRVLTERARHLMRNWRIPASAITVVAFNRRAQEELKERTADLPGLQVRTLNSLALAILNGTAPFGRNTRSFATIGEPEIRRVLSGLINLPRRRNTDPLAPWIEALSQIRLGLRDPSAVEELYNGDVAGLQEVWPQYQNELDRRGWVDFDGQIYGAILALLTDPEVRAAAQRVCQVLCVDEFQDLTPAHILMIRLLGGPEAAVFGVGDDDQTIYGYSGADPAWLIDFDRLFPGSGAQALEVNYRCPTDLVAVVERLLRHNRRRVQKVIRAAPERNPQPQGWSTVISGDPVADTAQCVGELLQTGSVPGEIAILARVNAVLVPVQVALIHKMIPVVGGVGLEFLEHTAVRAFLAWMRLGQGKFRAADLVEALRRPSRPLHPRCTTWVSEQSDVAGLQRLSIRLRDERESQRVMDFATDIERLGDAMSQGASTTDCVRIIVDEFGLGPSISTVDANRRGMNRASQSDDLTALKQLAPMQPDPQQFEEWLRTSLSVTTQEGGVLLSTVHRVKGQQWPQVILHFADREQFPHRLSEDTDEERRLFHVALTRAQSHVTVVTGSDPSKFITELTTEPDLMAPEPTPTALIRSSVTPKSAKATGVDVGAMSSVSQRAYELLREYRSEVKGSRPAYLVFDDATLKAIAEALPESLSELASIRGIGPTKLELHGDAVLGAVQLALSESIT